MSGNTTTKATPITASGARTSMPIHVPTQIIAEAKASSSTMRRADVQHVGVGSPADQQAGRQQHDDRQQHAGELGQVVAHQVRGLLAGSERNRSMTPSCRSVAIDVAGPVMPNASDWIRMPPMMNSR